MATKARPLAVVTGASSGIGLELARCCVHEGYDAIVAAAGPEIYDVALGLRASGAEVEAVQTDLATHAGVQDLYAALGGRRVHALLAHAGLGHSFSDRSWDDARGVIDTNVAGTFHLLHQVAADMRATGAGRILITGSITGFVPGTFQAVYDGSKALLESFALALRAELRDSGVSVTCLVPGATATGTFESAQLLDTAGQESPEDVAKLGFAAMLRGDSEVATSEGKDRRGLASMSPSAMLASQRSAVAKPGSAA